MVSADAAAAETFLRTPRPRKPRERHAPAPRERHANATRTVRARHAKATRTLPCNLGLSPRSCGVCVALAWRAQRPRGVGTALAQGAWHARGVGTRCVAVAHGVGVVVVADVVDHRNHVSRRFFSDNPSSRGPEEIPTLCETLCELSRSFIRHGCPGRRARG